MTSLAYMTNFDLIYLATPYTLFPGGWDLAFKQAAILTSKLLRLDIHVFSPVVHAHPVAIYGDIDPIHHELWTEINRSYIRKSDAMLIGMLDGWQKSRGIELEMNIFKEQNKSVYYINPKTLEIESPPSSL